MDGEGKTGMMVASFNRWYLHAKRMLQSFFMTTDNGEAQLEFDLRKTPAANILSISICTLALITGLRRYGGCLMGRVPGLTRYEKDTPCSGLNPFYHARTGAHTWTTHQLNYRNRALPNRGGEH